MLLQRLKDYADRRMKLPPTHYSRAPVRYIVELDGNGRLLNPAPIDTVDPSHPGTRRGELRHVPQVQRTVAVKPLLLADNAEYTFGLGRETSRPERVAECHRAYLALIDRCVDATGEPAVAAVRTFLASEAARQLRLPDDFDRGATITFRVDGVFPVDLPAVQRFWAAENDPSRGDAPIMQCIVCGEQRPVLERLQAKIKGVPGGQTSGTAIISANAGAFESYGLAASLIAPTCAECGERFTKAANELLGSRDSRMTLGGAAFIFWTREPVSFSLVDYFGEPRTEDVHGLLDSARKGGGQPEVDETAFYAAVLSGSGGRTVVRDWIDTTVGDVKRHLAAWFERQQIVGPAGEDTRPLGMYALAAATVRDPSKDLAPPTPRALWRTALTGAPLPFDLLAQTVRRNRAEQRVTRQRAAMIRLVLRCLPPDSPAHIEEGAMIKLDPDHPNPAYHCGRLLAVLDEAQRAAIPGINDTVVDRFYGTASTAPGSVFPRLLRGVRPHLAKLERDRLGTYRALERRLEEIQSNLRDFPRVLTLEDQGLFALGFYHQRAFDRAQAREASERRKAERSQPSPDANEVPADVDADHLDDEENE